MGVVHSVTFFERRRARRRSFLAGLQRVVVKLYLLVFDRSMIDARMTLTVDASYSQMS